MSLWPKRTQVQAQAGQVTTVDLGPDDRLVLVAKGRITPEQVDWIRDQWERAMTTGKVVLLPDHVRLVHVRGFAQRKEPIYP